MNKPTTREEKIAHLVKIAGQWGIRTTTGQPFTAAHFAKATDAWLDKEINKAFRGGEAMAQQ